MLKRFIPTCLFLGAVFLFTACGTIKQGDSPVIPLDPKVETGVLENGLTWYIRKNEEPKDRAVLRLAIKAGSLLEEDDQQGLAHLLEHMAFNGTKNFEKMELVNYLESIGMDFGPDINAHTSFEETVYKLEIPTDDQEILENAFQVLEDWAHLLTLDDGAIEEERGVVREEWRVRQGASRRVLDQILPVLFKDSRYAERLPIGKMEVVMESPAQRVKDFYRDWYHPALMAVVAVGDFDPSEIRRLVEKHFSFPPSRGAPKLPIYEIPPQKLPRVAIVSDSEVTSPSVELLTLKRPAEKRTEKDFRDSLIRGLFWRIFNRRLEDLTRQETPPFRGARGRESRYVSTAAFVSFRADLRSDELLGGVDVLVEEIFRAQRFGVTEGELSRTKKALDLINSRDYKEKDNISSSSFALDLVTHFLQGDAAIGLEDKYRLAQRFLSEITLEDVNLYARTIFPGENRILLMVLPETSPSPEEGTLLALLEEVESRTLAPPRDEEFGKLPQVLPGIEDKAVKKQSIEAWGAEEWILSNGARVIIKPTDFMEDEILFYGFSPGGLSLEEDALFHDGLYSPMFVQESGLGNFSAGALSEVLTGIDVQLSIFMENYFEGFSGSTSSRDFESLLSLTRLYFTEPRFDEEIFGNLMIRLNEGVKNRLANPFTVYTDRYREIRSSGAYRFRPLSPEILETLVFEEMKEVFSRRFSSAGDFTYILVGNIDPDEVEPMLAAYLGSLPGGTKEEWKDRGIRPPATIVDEEVKSGLDSKGHVIMTFTGEGKFSEEEENIFYVLGDVLEVQLREVLREDMGGTYSVNVSTELQEFPFSGWVGEIHFGCDPDRAEELSARVFEEIKKLQRGTLDPAALQREKEQYRRYYEVNIEENQFWLEAIIEVLQGGGNPQPPLSPATFAEDLTAERIVGLANRVFDGDRWIRLVLLPEDQG